MQKGHAPTRAPHDTPEVGEGRPGATRRRTARRHASDRDVYATRRGRATAAHTQWACNASAEAPIGGTHSFQCATHGSRGAHATDLSGRPGHTQAAPRAGTRLAGNHPQGSRLGPRTPGAVVERSQRDRVAAEAAPGAAAHGAGHEGLDDLGADQVALAGTHAADDANDEARRKQPPASGTREPRRAESRRMTASSSPPSPRVRAVRAAPRPQSRRGWLGRRLR